MTVDKKTLKEICFKNNNVLDYDSSKNIFLTKDDHTNIQAYLNQAFLLQGQLQALTEEKNVVVEKVKNAKIWLQKQPDYFKFLEQLQDILHQKNIGAFSELLSYFVRDVLQKEKDIVLELYTYHNLPALKIEASNDGNRENILTGNGGSIANIVSTGLRLIALSRMSNRQFIVLDEPDCWLKPEHIPLFAKIIGEISNKLNIQTVIVSHHHWKYFKDYGRVIELRKDGPHLITEIIHDTPISPNAKSDVIKTVILRKLMSHYDTTFNLHPNLTCIIGDNDIGKSVFTTSFKCIGYNDSSDSYIMHGENEAQIIHEFDNNRKILWQRFRVTDQENAQKVKYTLYKNDVKINSAYSSNEVPDFIVKELNISTVEDIDVHIGNQKEPVFLLGSGVKPQEKAKILSLGKESLIVQKMMENIKNKKKQCKQTEKDGEQRFQSIDRQINVLTNIDSVITTLKNLQSEFFILEERTATLKELETILQNLTLSYEINKLEKIEGFNLEIPQLYNLEELSHSILEIKFGTQINNISKIIFNPIEFQLYNTFDLQKIIIEIKTFNISKKLEKIVNFDINMPMLHNNIELNQIIYQLKNFKEISDFKHIEIDNDLPQLNDLTDLKNTILKLKEQETIKQDLNNKKENLEKWKIIIQNEYEAFIEKTNGLCPTCHQTFAIVHLLGEKHV